MSTPWRHDPTLAGRFHPEAEDDLQVILHDGEPRRSKLAPEACWVRVDGVAGILRAPAHGAIVDRTIYRGVLIHAPRHLTTVREGDVVCFVVAQGLPYPLQVTGDYIAERPRWEIDACDRCGATETLDPPSVMARTRFPDAPADAIVERFSAFCPCGGTMTLARLG